MFEGIVRQQQAQIASFLISFQAAGKHCLAIQVVGEGSQENAICSWRFEAG